MAENEKNYMEEPEEEMTVTLDLDDGTQLECAVLTIFEAGGRDYIALLPLDGAEEEEGEVYLYRYVETENGEPSLDNIEDDEEYEVVAAAFDQMLDDQEYDELVDEDDE
jgi:uncharacterized protein YrzB (UPF0473 family)